MKKKKYDRKARLADLEKRKERFAPNYRSVIYLIRRYMKQNKLTYQQMADRVGISKIALWKYCTFVHEMRANYLFALLHACKVELRIDNLLLGKNEGEEYLKRYNQHKIEQAKKSAEMSKQMTEFWAKKRAEQAAQKEAEEKERGEN